MIDFKRGAKTTGSKFYFNTGKTALLEWQLINRMISWHLSNGYKLIYPPYLVRRKVGEWAGQLPRFEGDYYMTKDDLMLIPTAETPLVGMHAGEVFKENELPKKYVAFSPCFRREAGTYGKRDKGLRRVHQFHKVELFQIVKPEESEQAFSKMLKEIVGLTRILGGKNIRTRELDEKERSPVAIKTVDVDIHLPSTGEWLEVSSVSNTGENQSKPALIRYRKDNKNIKCHLLNGSGLALPRLMLVLLDK